jgi:hypothetical protein
MAGLKRLFVSLLALAGVASLLLLGSVVCNGTVSAFSTRSLRRRSAPTRSRPISARTAPTRSRRYRRCSRARSAGFYHDGRFATLMDVVNHYDSCFNLRLTAQEKSDLVQYLKSR